MIVFSVVYFVQWFQGAKTKNYTVLYTVLYIFLHNFLSFRLYLIYLFLFMFFLFIFSVVIVLFAHVFSVLGGIVMQPSFPQEINKVFLIGIFIDALLSSWQHGTIMHASYQCPALFQNLWFNELINNLLCVHRHKEGSGMSLHGHRYCGRLQWQRANSSCPLAILAGQFPRRRFCERSHSCDSSSLCSLHPGGHSKAQPTASICTSVCLLWTPAALVPPTPHILHWAVRYSWRELYLYHHGSLAVAIYNQLISPFDLSLHNKRL